MSMQSKLNAVEGIDKVSQTLAVELGAGESRLGKKREGKVEEEALYSQHVLPPR